MKKILETQNLILREFVMEDAPALQKILSDKDVMRFSIWGPLDLEATKIFLEKTAIESYKENGFGKWAVIHKDTNTLIGICGLLNEDIGTNEIKTELGYRLAKEFWGKGLGTEAARAVRDYAFTTLDLDEIVSCIDKENIPSIRVAEKNGMTFWKEGSLFGLPCQIYHITKSEWEEITKQENIIVESKGLI